MKMLKSKNIRRICVLLAMLAPVVYLFGSLFSALAGAHGTEVFAEPVYVESWVEVDSFVDDGSSYKYTVPRDEFRDFIDWVPAAGSTVACEFVVDDVSFIGYQAPVGSGTIKYFTCVREIPVDGSRSYLFGYINESNNEVVVKAMPWNFIFTSNLPFYNSQIGTLYKLVSVPTSEVPENAGAFSDYVFKNFFAKDNFLEQIGKDVLSENPHGFVPFASFWKYLDNNMLHMGDMQLGLMGYGYVYYCCHVLLFDIAFILVTFFLDFIQKVNDKVVGGVD